jgi:outer membrane receptor for ferrienterochelin and colicins
LKEEYFKIMKKQFLFLLVGLSTSVFSQQSDTTILDEVVVTATRSEITLENSPIPTEVIGRNEIETLNLITMQDLLQVKGFFVAPMKSGGFQLRGLSSEYVLVMIDGVPIAGRESGALDVSNILLSNVERVEIVKGSMSALWGNYAIGGVINIITKKGGEPQTTINTQYGSQNQFLTGITSTFSKGKIFNNSKITYGGSDGFDIDEDLAGKNVLPNRLLNVSNTLGFQSGVHNLSLGLTHFNNQSEGSTITETNTEGQLVPVDEVNLSKNFITDFSYKGYFGRLVTELKISNSNFTNSDESKFVYFGQSVTQLDESEQNIFQPEIINSFNWNGQHQTTFGGGLINHSFNTERYGGEKTLDSRFAYLQHYFGWKNLNLVAGARYDNYDNFGNNLSPKVSAKYNLGKFSINSSVGYGFRVPDFRTLFINYGGYTQGFYVLGASNIGERIEFHQSQGQLPRVFYDLNDITQLRPETSISYDFGVSYKLNEQSKIGVNLFQTNTTDLIESVLVGAFVNRTLLFGYTNISEAKFTGIELEALYQKDGFRFDGSYQYLETQANKSDGTEFFLGERPKHLVNFSTTYTTKSKFTINLNGVYKSDYFFRDIDRNGTQDENEFVPQHTLLNGIVTKKFDKFSFGVGSNNILNFTNREYLKFQNGRTLFTKLTYNL